MARKNIALLALEGEMIEDQLPVEGAEVVADQIEASPEAELVEMQEIAQEMDDIEAARDEGMDTVETMGRVEEKLEEAIDETGGIDPIAAEAIKICLEHMQCRMTGGTVMKTFALEGFKSKTTRIQATNMAMESFKETAKKVWDGIIATIQRAMKAVKEFFARFFDAAKKQAYRAEQLAKAAEAKKDAKVEGKVKAQAILRLDNKFIEAGALKSALEANHKIIQDQALYGIGDTVSSRFVKVAETALKKVVEGGGENEFREIEAALTELCGGLKEKGDGKYESDALIGDVVIKAELVLEKAKLTVAMGDSAAKKDMEAAEIDAAEPAKVAEIAKAVKAQMEDLVKAQDEIKKIEKAQVGLLSAIKKMWTAGKAAVDDGAKGKVGVDNTNLVITAINSFISFSSTFVSRAKQYEASVASAALAYGAASLKLASGDKSKTAVVPA